jgi:hypothetical protein
MDCEISKGRRNIPLRSLVVDLFRRAMDAENKSIRFHKSTATVISDYQLIDKIQNQQSGIRNLFSSVVFLKYIKSLFYRQ